MSILNYEIIIIVIGVITIIALDLMGKNKNWGAVLMLAGLLGLIANFDGQTLPHRLMEALHEAWVAPVFVMAAGFATDYYQQSGAMSVLSSRIKGVWSLGIIVFILSMFFDNTVATLIGLSLVSVTQGRAAFATAIALWALLGGLFSPIGDITTLMLWLAKKLSTTGVIFNLALPAIAGYFTYTFLVKDEIKFEVLANKKGTGGIKELLIAALLFISIALLEVFFHISPGISVLFVAFASFWILRGLGHQIDVLPHDPKELASLKKTSIYIALVLFSVGLIQPDLSEARSAVEEMSLATLFATSIGVSSHVDNIPWTALLIAVLNYTEDSYEWLVICIAVGLGGGLSPIGSTSTLLSSSSLGVGFKGFYKYFWKMLLTIGVVFLVLYIENMLGFI